MVFRLRVVHEYEISIAARRGRKRLSGPLRDDPHLDPGLFGEARQDLREQTRVFDRCRRGEHDCLPRRWFGRGRIGPLHRAEQQENRESDGFHSSPFSAMRKPGALIAMLRPIRTSPSPIATARWPLRASTPTLLAVVRIHPAIFPPPMTTP